MFYTSYNEETQTLILEGVFDASKTESVKQLLKPIENSITVDMKNLEFICSGGIGTLVMMYRKLAEKGEKIKLINLNDHIKKVFQLSLLDKVFKID